MESLEQRLELKAAKLGEIRLELMDQLKQKEEEEKKDANYHKVQEYNLKDKDKPIKLYRIEKIVAHGSFGLVYRAVK